MWEGERERVEWGHGGDGMGAMATLAKVRPVGARWRRACLERERDDWMDKVVGWVLVAWWDASKRQMVLGPLDVRSRTSFWS